MELHVSQIIKPNWEALDEVDAWKVTTFLAEIKKAFTAQAFTTFGYKVRALMSVVFTSKKNYKRCSAEQLLDIYHDKGLFFHKPLTSFYLKKLKIKGAVLFAPMDELENLTFNHFKYLDGAFTALLLAEHEKQNATIEAAIKKFIATLYISKQGFDKTKVEAYSKNIKLLPYQVSLCLIAYANTRAAMMERCPNLFPKVEAEDKEVAPVYTGKMWHDMHMDIGETKAFQGFEQAGNANVYDVLDYLEKKQVDYLKEKSKQ